MLGKFLNLLLLATVLETSVVHAMDEPEDIPKNQPVQNSKPPYTDPRYQSKRADIAVLQEYFSELSEHVDSYRLFFIWGTGEKKLIKDYKSYIGGLSKNKDNKRAVTWFNLSDDFLEASKAFKGKFTFEIMVDEKTLNDNSENIEALQKKFPTIVKITPISELLESLQPPQVSRDVFSLLEHLEKGNPAIGSDMLRVLKLYNPEYTLNVYSDSDSFTRHLKFSQTTYRPKDTKDHRILSYKDIFKGELTAAKATEDTLLRMKYSWDGNVNDHLVSKGNTKEKLNQCVKTFEKWLPVSTLQSKTLEWYKVRSEYFSDYQTYRAKLNEFIPWLTDIFYHNHPKKLISIDVNTAVTHLTGPSSTLYWDVFKTVEKESILLASKASWTPLRSFLNTEGFDTFCTTTQGYYPENGTGILSSLWRVRWMINDWDMMTSTGQYENVRHEVKNDFVKLITDIKRMLDTGAISQKYNGIPNLRERIIKNINATLINDKIWFSSSENKFYFLQE
jgi:hypothetical protein